MLNADMSLSLEPVAPWSAPVIGPAAMLGVALVLAALTLWTYLGVTQATWRRVLIVLCLRLAALALVFGMMLRPSFAFTQLEGVETSKLLVLADASESMNVADAESKPSRWEQVNRLWSSAAVQRRLKQLAAEQKVEVVKYLAAETLRPDDGTSVADGKRTDIGVWLHELWLKHGSDKRIRGVLLFSDGADNGTRFPVQEKARLWRGAAPIHAFGAGDPSNAKFKKDIGLTGLVVKTKPVSVQALMEIEAVAQAPGLENAKANINVTMERVEDKKRTAFAELKSFEIKQAKDQRIAIKGTAPKEPGEYKVTLEIEPHPDEANKENNKISTYVNVIKSTINVLWVDRFRVYEPTFAIRFALDPEQRFAVNHKLVPAKDVADPAAYYQLDMNPDVIVIGDISAREFSFGKPEVFDRIKKAVEEGAGLLMLGGSETFATGGWDKVPQIMSLLPVTLDAANPDYSEREIYLELTSDGKQMPFLQLHPDPKKNQEVWNLFEPLDGLAPLGKKVDGAANLVMEKNAKDRIVMAMTVAAKGRVVVFGGDSTFTWRENPDNPEVIRGYNHFWKNLIFWLAKQEDNANQVWIALDKRRMSTDAADTLGFTFGLRGKDGRELPDATFKAEVIGPGKHAVQFVGEKDHQRGSFRGPAEPGEYQLKIKGTAKDVFAENSARFVVAAEDIEMLRPAADHDTLMRIASDSEGRLHPLDEAELLQFLDELKTQVNRESRQKTVYWPNWKHVPASDSLRDQLPGLWNSFALVNLLLFVGLIGCEWLLRRQWGLV